MLMVANSESLRQQNRALVLSALRKHEALAHTDISDWTGISSATVSAITADLVKEQIIIKTEAQNSTGRGRPKVLFKQNPDIAYIIVIKVTSEEVEFSLTDYSGILKDRFTDKRPANNETTSGFMERLKAGIERILERSKLPRDKIKTISISSKGLVADGRPVLLWSPVFGGQEIDFEAHLADSWPKDRPVRIVVTNETQFTAQALASKLKTEAPQFQTRRIATLSLGHSIGLGIASERPGRAIQSTAPAFGHMIHDNSGPLCRCGAHGCIEAYAGFYGILRTAFEVPANTIPAKFVPIEEMDRLAANARRGDRMAERAFREAGEVLGIGMSRLMSMHGILPLYITGPGLNYFDLMQIEIERPILGNLQVRFGEAPEIHIHADQSNLVYQGNIETCLSYMDTNVLAVGVRKEADNVA